MGSILCGSDELDEGVTEEKTRVKMEELSKEAEDDGETLGEGG